MLTNKKILLGVTGSISVYKSCDVLRKLVKSGAEVKVVLTKGAEKFVTPFTFSALSKNRAYTDKDFFNVHGEILHIELASFPDIIVIAPASASFLAKAASGQADELLLAVLLATKKPVYIFPAMNENMWEHPLTQQNIQILKKVGYKIFEPAEGSLACEISGKGRLPEPSVIVEIIKAHFYPKNLKGKKILITGGPTKEFIDKIRFITNFSSGKIAYYLTKEAYYRGGEVFLVWGGNNFPDSLPELPELPFPKIFKVDTTKEMYEVCQKIFPQVDIAIFASAPVDIRPKKYYPGKLKKSELLDTNLELEITEDIAKELLKNKGNKIAIGFALEEEKNLLKYAIEKKKEKNFDYLVANPLSTMGRDISDFYILTPTDIIELKQVSKEKLASELFRYIST